jgi:hypothetical protein
VLCCAGAAGLALFAATRTWATTTVVRPVPLPRLVEAHSGSQLAPWLPALAAVAVAAAGALVATRGVVRAVVGVVLVCCGLGVGSALAGLVAADVESAGAGVGWATLCVGCGVVIAAVGVLAVRAASAWPSLGARFDSVAGATPASAGPRRERPGNGTVAMWVALDRGEDPTADDGSH